MKVANLFILPMRNGNQSETQENIKVENKPFYPTYEEWKHGEANKVVVVQHAFYPTYEEWKRVDKKQISLSLKDFLSYL